MLSFIYGIILSELFNLPVTQPSSKKLNFNNIYISENSYEGNGLTEIKMKSLPGPFKSSIATLINTIR